MNFKKAARILTIVTVVAILAAAFYIMFNRLGLVEGFDFGAGAYYYADIPAEDYAKIDPDGSYKTSVPTWVHIVLFLAWGFLMWKLWKWIDS